MANQARVDDQGAPGMLSPLSQSWDCRCAPPQSAFCVGAGALTQVFTLAEPALY